MGFFFRRSRAANSVVNGRISPNFELIQALMYIIITCKYEMNPIKNVRENVMTPFPTVTLSVAMETSGRIWPNFELIQALMHVLITCKYEKNPSKNCGENVMTPFSPLYVYGIFFIHSRADNSVVCGRIRPNFELIQALMHVIVICKYEKDSIKNILENVMTPFFPL